MAPNSVEFKNKFAFGNWVKLIIVTLWFYFSNAGISPADLIDTAAKDTISWYNFGNSGGRSKSFYDTCIWDVTANSWDMNWWWDSDCISDLTLKWEVATYHCLNEKTNNNILSADKWYIRDRITDTQDFIEETYSITTSTDFSNQIVKAEDNFSTPLIPTTTTTPTLYSLGVNLYLSSGITFKFPLPNSFGLWDQVQTVSFLKDINSTTCTRYTTLSTWDKNLNGNSYTSLTFYSEGTTNTVAVTAGTIWVVTDLTKAVSTSTTSFQAASLSTSGTSCTCSNLLKEIHYTVYTSGSTKITSITADVVYVTLAAATWTNTIRFDQTYSITFKDSQYSRVQSGSPGYQKGLKLLAGAVSSTTANFISANEGGFELYGADESGNCLIDSTSFTTTSSYYRNPILTFNDGAIYGWKLTYTNTQLQTFCTGTDNQNIALFKNLINNLKYVGIYGNSNPNFISDWVAVNYVSTSATSASYSGRGCSFDGGMSLRVYLTRLGTTSNPQYKVSAVRVIPQRILWTHSKLLSTDTQDFHALLSISYHIVPQGSTDFNPSVPNDLPKMPKNTLYPFFLSSRGYEGFGGIAIFAVILLFLIIDL